MDDFIDSREAVGRTWHGRRWRRGILRYIGTAFRLLMFCLSVAGGFWLCAGVSMANSPGRARSVVISPRNIPEGTQFLDLLIPMSKDDPYYCGFNQSMGEAVGLAGTAPIKAGRSGYLAGTIDYDCSTGQLSPSIYKGNGMGMLPAAAILLLLSSAALAVRAVFTAAVESMVSLVFKVRPWTTVFVVNVISNMVFNLLLVMGTALLQIPYLAFVTAGEIIVVWAEYTVYRRRLVSCGQSRVLFFTITANLISLLLGILLNYLLPGRALL